MPCTSADFEKVSVSYGITASRTSTKFRLKKKRIFKIYENVAWKKNKAINFYLFFPQPSALMLIPYLMRKHRKN